MFASGAACGAALLLGACGGQKSQDENEPSGNFQVEVVDASFPGKQKLAKRSDLVIKVRNTGTKAVPNIAVTLSGFSKRSANKELADRDRPLFVINGVPKELGGIPETKEAAPAGCDTAYVGTWACGKLKPGKERTFKWTVTAVVAGNYSVSYKVAAGLDGKAKAVAPGGGAPRGSFTGKISDAAPETRVADDGKTVIEGTR